MKSRFGNVMAVLSSRWRDPRLVAGILLIVAAVSLNIWWMARVSNTTVVYGAARDLAGGEPLDAGSLQALEVNLRSTTDLYLTKMPPSGAVVKIPVGKGELVAKAAVGTADKLTGQEVVANVRGPLAAGMKPGTSVDVWFLGRTDKGSAIKLSGSAQITQIREKTSDYGQERIPVTLRVRSGMVDQLVTAVAAGATIVLVEAIPGQPQGAQPAPAPGQPQGAQPAPAPGQPQGAQPAPVPGEAGKP